MEQVKGTLNRVELIGWVGADPRSRFLPSGTAVCEFSIATKRVGGRNEAGERTFETDWTPSGMGIRDWLRWVLYRNAPAAPPSVDWMIWFSKVSAPPQQP